MAKKFYINRKINLRQALEKKSHFLFGPRGVGKSTHIRESLPSNVQIISLLGAEERIRLTENPAYLSQMIGDYRDVRDGKQVIVIDEIQKIPALLDEVHALIESHGIHFLLTGSSAKKLKRSAANLLAGRAWLLEMYGFIHAETPEIPLLRKLQYGSLPSVLLSDYPWEELKAYADTYLKEEIEGEATVRNLGQFVRFLKVAGIVSGQIINYASVARDASVTESTVRRYFEILIDSLLGVQVDPWRESKKRKAIKTSKFYLFDTGVLGVILDRRQLNRASNEFGVALEHWVLHELRAIRSIRRTHWNITYWRSTSGLEVDFCLDEKTAIEVKATERLTERDFKGLKALAEEGVFRRYVMVSFDKTTKKWIGKGYVPNGTQSLTIECWYIEDFLLALCKGEFD